MSDDNKESPREWLAWEIAEQVQLFHFSSQPFYDKSAYDSIVRERDELKRRFESAHDNEMYYMKERDQAVADAKALAEALREIRELPKPHWHPPDKLTCAVAEHAIGVARAALEKVEGK